MNTTLLSPDTRGNKPLWIVFWIYGVLVSHLYFGAIIYSYRTLGTPVLGALLAGFVLYTAWIMRSVWVNAFNVGNETYGHIARYLTVAWALNAVLVSGFLFLGHLDLVSVPI
ncbi:hypothetical protein P8H27_08530 [Pseudomonas sp. sp1636]|uniref:hypothetical protein n=1 Tax=Pseudomonas sp. sp1636 TaxID=3036707 RepID=UPI0025A58D24|nr:hypothetical protein [Pseudomonas sp. sp1636]MDM8348947.1 hypothetical protein [Pseudomonas sp. sp1636]